ncbi:MAG TPA: trypsin-like peptidase domain-containing protein, partial [Candidatus Sulfopaludibacter sp.]|nr:trypsin-like peptidase domain-containing protein [Candidatus Sulfopaludibacter sp.]
DGLILTNAHVARDSDAQIELWDGRRLDARVTLTDPRRDLAALRVTPGDCDGLAASVGDSDKLRPGELVIAVGSPLGFAGAVSTGVVHSIGPLPGMWRQNWIRADVQLAPGNSGGPLANAQGQVVGMNTAIVHGMGVAVPASVAVDFVRGGARPSLGVVLRPVRLGLEILKVEPGGAASAASLCQGDVLLGSFDALSEALDSGRDVVRLRFFRGGVERIREVYVPLTARAQAA